MDYLNQESQLKLKQLSDKEKREMSEAANHTIKALN
jgi:hypothetical protein